MNPSGSKISKEMKLAEIRMIQSRPQLWFIILFLINNNKAICYDRNILIITIARNLDLVILWVNYEVMIMEGRISTIHHRWDLPGDYPISSMVMLIYHYVEIIEELLLLLIVCITHTIMKQYYPVKPVNIYINNH